MREVLKLEGLQIKSAERLLIKALSLQAKAGERWAVIGRNAVGKTTLLRALAGLPVSSVQGRIELAPGLRLAYVPQQQHDRFAWTVQEYLALHAQQGNTEGGSELLQPDLVALDVAHLLQRPVTHLSGGERQRVALAALTLQNATLWLLDEPVSAQDPKHQMQVARWLMAQTDKAMILSAHDMSWIQQVATHVVLLLGHEAQAECHVGQVDQVLTAERLRQGFDCDWTLVDGYWMARYQTT
jgi:iron complex transport system ATP-binding protein